MISNDEDVSQTGLKILSYVYIHIMYIYIHTHTQIAQIAEIFKEKNRPI